MSATVAVDDKWQRRACRRWRRARAAAAAAAAVCQCRSVVVVLNMNARCLAVVACTLRCDRCCCCDDCVSWAMFVCLVAATASVRMTKPAPRRPLACHSPLALPSSSSHCRWKGKALVSYCRLPLKTRPLAQSSSSSSSGPPYWLTCSHARPLFTAPAFSDRLFPRGSRPHS
ncbi:unnamed protein product [Schistocephalus solidus]|uniref:Uncharacterized protein n=1 Tax=Schistocephalus solidus TaxID=70667 RepID=A0A183TPQ0_SCHSO|nr:unnamed protein product [Schistocephalus solidus]